MLFFCYSIEFVYSYEKAKKAKNTTVYWAGTGVVGSFYYLDKPTIGFEIAIEKRHYFKPDKFMYFFISAYIGSAYVTDFNYTHNLGLVPGFKINYKTYFSKKLMLEP